ncbi:hypothetical protein OC861_000929 [Tilletia horrida]|nr:hypothetical protein OC861_000929 [Tilletia horrida]
MRGSSARALLLIVVFLLVLDLNLLGARATAIKVQERSSSVQTARRFLRRTQTLFRRVVLPQKGEEDFGLVNEDGALSLARLLDLRRQQQVELLDWWNGTTTVNSTWTVLHDDARLQKLLPEQLNYATFANLSSLGGEAYFWNISGYYQGQYSASELYALPGNGSSSAPGYRTPSNSNITKSNIQVLRGNFPWLDIAGGTLEVEISEDHTISPNLTTVQGNLILKSRAQSKSLWSTEVVAGAQVRFDLAGIHYLGNGGLLVSALPAESWEVPDNRMVLDMLPPSVFDPTSSNSSEGQVPSAHPSEVLNVTVHAINTTLTNEVDRLTDSVGDKDPTEPVSQPTDDRISHNCTDFHLYLRLAPATSSNATARQLERVREYERELFFSTGASPLGLLGQGAPRLRIEHAVLYSHTCNLVLNAGQPEFAGLNGLRYISHRRKIMRAALALAVVTMIQLRLTIGMMRRARTASARVKIDWRTLLLQTVADMYTSILCAIPAVVWRNETDLLLAAVSFIVGCHFVGGEYQFLIFVVHDSQNDPMNNRPAQPTAATATPATPAPAAVPTGEANAAADGPTTEGTVPAPATTTTVPATPEPPTAAEQAALDRHRYIGILVFFFLVNFQPLVFFSILGPVLYSFWIPQILRNIKRGSRRPFPRKYVFGMTACRCALPLSNIFFWEPTPLVWILIGYLWAQALILLLQDEFGPAFFLPARFKPEGPPTWDWHPPVSVLRRHIRQAEAKSQSPNSNDKAGQAADLETSARHELGDTGSKHSQGQEIEIGDCAICLSEIEPLRWDWQDEGEVDDAAEESDGDEEVGDATGDEYAYRPVSGGDQDAGMRPSGTQGGAAATAGGTGGVPESPQRRRRHLRTGSVLASWTSSAARMGRRLQRAIAAAREQGGRGRSGAAAATAALGGGRTDIMVAPCHHIFHTECLERWLQYKSECPSCRLALPPA